MVSRGQIKKKGQNKKYKSSKVIRVWSDGKIIKGPKSISSLNYTLHYSSPNAWEGIRAYKQPRGGAKIWKLKEHIQRFFDTAMIQGFEIPFSFNEIVEGCEAVVVANGNGNLYIRPIAYVTQTAEIIKPQNGKVSVDIYALPIPEFHDNAKKGIKVAISGQMRGYPQYQMQTKSASNYHFLQTLNEERKSRGVDDLLLTDNQGHITEALVANIFVIKGDVIMTPPNDGSILPGITRKCIAELLQSPQLMVTKYKKTPIVIEKKITRADLYTADCVILCGTYAEIVNVLEIDGRKIGNEEKHFYYKMLAAEYSSLVRGGHNEDSKKH